MLKYGTVALAIFGATGAFADQVNATIEDHYRTVTETTNETRTQCEMVQVPVYGTRQREFDTGGAVMGGLIGGLLGNQVGGGSGRDAATGVGAIAGAIIGGGGGQTTNQITGYRQERQCSEVLTPVSVQRTVYSHSTITFMDGGQMISLNYTK